MLKKTINFLKNIKKVTETFESKLEVSNRTNYLLNSALTSNESIISSEVNNKELIVSLTTYSKRIHDVHLIIESIAHQTLKPNRIILWLDEEEFTLNTIPLILKKQIARGLEVRFCPNYKSYKKLIPTLKISPKANIVTIDDDILYPYDMLELLYNEHLLNPDCVVGHRVHKITLDAQKNILPYSEWEQEATDKSKSNLIMAIGIGGIFYPSGILSEECLNIKNFTLLAPNADDIWFKAMSLLTNAPHKKVSDERNFWERFLVVESSQDIALFHNNQIEHGNDSQFKAVFEKYNLYKKLK
ncbi:glycosyl transferase [Pseudoalteromonas agarivorans]|uniref:glycosyl transferase n=1 Tax=Pseudoalteromonas agarivorans TaxID=176102 RepID=UPI0021175175|nr:glycosyl transferase [Pseudoalteromonas agarivorans]